MYCIRRSIYPAIVCTNDSDTEYLTVIIERRQAKKSPTLEMQILQTLCLRFYEMFLRYDFLYDYKVLFYQMQMDKDINFIIQRQ